MRTYVPITDAERKQMLETIGVSSMEELLCDVPESVRLKGPLQLPRGQSEADVLRAMQAYAAENAPERPLFRGGGAYYHFIPAILNALTERGEFLTAYTPYQAEMSQGMLQAIYEYQSLMCRLTGMDVSNASVYDGATAAAEAMTMCREAARKKKMLVTEGVLPYVREVLETYAPGAGIELVTVPLRGGVTDLDALRAAAEGAAGLIAATPNCYGILEDLAPMADIMHENKALLVSYVEPFSLALVKKPGALGADIAVGEGQPLGIPLSFGGPYLGFMTAKQKLLRLLPGRIVGETVDEEGNRCYVLTLQAREQHIRREKAQSNICSNEGLCAVRAAIYLTAMGPQGMREAAEACLRNAHALAERICSVPGFRLAYPDKPFFLEFLIASDLPARSVDGALREAGIVGGLQLDAHHMLWCATEMNTVAEMDAVKAALEVFA